MRHQRNQSHLLPYLTYVPHVPYPVEAFETRNPHSVQHAVAQCSAQCSINEVPNSSKQGVPKQLMTQATLPQRHSSSTNSQQHKATVHQALVVGRCHEVVNLRM